MMRLDHSRLTAQTRLNYIGIDCSLCQEIYLADFLCFFFKYTDEFFSDNFSLLFRLCYSCKLRIVTLLRIDSYEVDIEGSAFSENAFHFISFVLTK